MATSHPLNLIPIEGGACVHLPAWSGPKHVKLLVSTRKGGFSQGEFTAWNLAQHVGDDPLMVSKNQEVLHRITGKNAFWLEQVHGNKVFYLENSGENTPLKPKADGIVSQSPLYFLGILTADCLPIMFTDKGGEVIAACHAGWRGLANGIIENTVFSMVQKIRPDDESNFRQGIHVYIGPAISQKHFEVGQDVRDAFNLSFREDILNKYFLNLPNNKYLADLFGLAMSTLNHSGIIQISTERYCCYEDNNNFYSYRRQAVTGRFASCIWLE